MKGGGGKPYVVPGVELHLLDGDASGHGDGGVGEAIDGAAAAGGVDAAANPVLSVVEIWRE